MCCMAIYLNKSLMWHYICRYHWKYSIDKLACLFHSTKTYPFSQRYTINAYLTRDVCPCTLDDFECNLFVQRQLIVDCTLLVDDVLLWQVLTSLFVKFFSYHPCASLHIVIIVAIVVIIIIIVVVLTLLGLITFNDNAPMCPLIQLTWCPVNHCS